MNIPFDFSVSPGAGTAAFVKLLDQTANLVLAGIISANPGGGSDAFTKLQKSANLGALDPTGPTVHLANLLATRNWFVRSLSITANAACKVRLGTVNAAGNSFSPVYTTFGGEAIAGGIVRQLTTGPMIFNDNSTWFAALEITPDAAGTCKVAGDVEIQVADGTY